jgi:hypothetical protein
LPLQVDFPLESYFGSGDESDKFLGNIFLILTEYMENITLLFSKHGT